MVGTVSDALAGYRERIELFSSLAQRKPHLLEVIVVLSSDKVIVVGLAEKKGWILSSILS